MQDFFTWDFALTGKMLEAPPPTKFVGLTPLFNPFIRRCESLLFDDAVEELLP
jgi:hypothetical protein